MQYWEKLKSKAVAAFKAVVRSKGDYKTGTSVPTPPIATTSAAALAHPYETLETLQTDTITASSSAPIPRPLISPAGRHGPGFARSSNAVRSAGAHTVPNTDLQSSGDTAPLVVKGDGQQAPPTTPGDLWKAAQSMLDEKDRQKLAKIKEQLTRDRNPGSQSDQAGSAAAGDIDAVISNAKKLKDVDQEKEWQLYTNKVIDAAVTFKKLGDAAVKFDKSGYGALAWSLVSFGLEVAKNAKDARSLVFTSSEIITRLRSRYAEYESLYRSGITDAELEERIVDVYKALLLYMIAMNDYLQQGGWGHSARAILPIDDHTIAVKKKEVERADEEATRYVDHISREKYAKHRYEELFRPVDSLEQCEILDWVSKTQYTKHHNIVKETRTQDTCEWLLQREDFYKWKATNSSAILWLQGSPGAGKTYLTSKAIEHIQSLYEGSPNDGFAFFYCDRNDDDRRQPLSVLRSYVRQLSIVPGRPGAIRTKLRALCRELKLKGSDLGFDACRDLLLESVNVYCKTTLVLDALDECEPISRRRLVDAIEFLLANTRKPLKVFISSRPDADIRARFLSHPQIEIRATDNQEDIEKFVNEEIVNHLRWNKMSPSLRGDIVKTLHRSDGMFQWASLQIKQLLELQTEAAIRDRLGKLPDDLEAAYKEIYNKIATRNEHDKILADRAFMWVMCASHPLTSVELFSAIRLDPDGETWHLSEEVDEDLLLGVCNNLLVLDSQRKVWRFSHLSVAEYFEDNHWSRRQAQCYAAKVCLLLLNQSYKNLSSESKAGSECSHNTEPFDLKHPLQIYIRHHWIIHTQTQEGLETDPTLTRLLKTFLGSLSESSSQYRAWHRQISSDGYNRPLTSAFTMRGISPETTPIWVVCHFSVYTLILDWWQTAEIALSQANFEGDDLLTVAAAAGCKPICEILIERGMQANVLQSPQYGSALAAAARRGRTEVVEFLVEKGADVHMVLKSGRYGSALAAAAAAEGETEVVKFLVEKGADVNMVLEGGEYGSALAAAAWRGRTEVVEFLVEKGADVNMVLKSGRYGSALAAAAWSGRTEVVEFLVEKGADVNMVLKSGEYGSALAAAAYLGWRECVEFLMVAGVDLNFRLEDKIHTALQAAQKDILVEDRDLLWWDCRDDEDLKRDKAEVVEQLQLAWWKSEGMEGA